MISFLPGDSSSTTCILYSITCIQHHTHGYHLLHTHACLEGNETGREPHLRVDEGDLDKCLLERRERSPTCLHRSSTNAANRSPRKAARPGLHCRPQHVHNVAVQIKSDRGDRTQQSMTPASRRGKHAQHANGPRGSVNTRGMKLSIFPLQHPAVPLLALGSAQKGVVM